MWITDLGHGLESCLFPSGPQLVRTQPQTVTFPQDRAPHGNATGQRPSRSVPAAAETEQQAGGSAWSCLLLPALRGPAGAFAACWESWWGAGAQRPWASGGPGLQFTGHLRGRGRKGQKGAGHSWTRKPLQQLSGEEAPVKATKVISGSKHPKKQVEVPSDD